MSASSKPKIEATDLRRLLSTAPMTTPVADMTPISHEAVQQILNTTDWDKYWREVREQADAAIEAYRDARARSLNATTFVL